MFISSANATDYGPALDSVKNATLIQSGLQKELDVMLAEANRRLAWFIDTEMPFSSKDVYFGAGLVYAVGVRREIVQTFPNPWLKNVRHTLTFSATTKTFNIQFNF